MTSVASSGSFVFRGSIAASISLSNADISAQIYYPWQAADILEAECGALWAGERTAAETATQIQKRMELYLAENAT